MRAAICLFAALFAAHAVADPAIAAATNEFARAKYVLFCAGCHGYEGEGGGGDGGAARISAFVPAIGTLLRDPEGRRYLLNVGGVTSAGMTDAETAIVLNYVLRAFGRETLPEDFVAYSATEVAAERRQPVADPVAMQKDIRVRLRSRGIRPPEYQWENR